MSELFAIGQLAQQLGVSTSAIRFYEDEGLLEPTTRVSGQRRYSDSAAARVGLIKLAQSAGFTISEIRQLLRGFPTGTSATRRWGALVDAKKREISRRREELDAMSSILERISSCSCPSLDDCGNAARRFLASDQDSVDASIETD